ncbi:MAG: fused MFS/spermidine synthase [Vulcanimicrobiota bacterium]
MTTDRSKLGEILRASMIFFFLSGSTGLIYQVLWTRRLTLCFGHTVLAVSTVLTAFMTGLALGSLLAGRWADRTSAQPGSPVRFLAYYGYLEASIGVWALLSLPLLSLVEKLYLHLSTSGVTGTALYLACFAGSMLVLVPPTTAMGATVPVMSRLLVHERGDIGRLLSRLYGINTLGAFSGAGLAGFLLLPNLGLRLSMLLAACINLTIGCSAVWLVRSGRLVLDESEQAETAPAAEASNPRSFAGWVVPLTFGLAGISSMALQVAWTRGLALSLGSSVYAFSSILVTFLAGLGLGSLLYPRIMGSREPTLTHLGLLQLGIGALAGLTIPALGYFPLVFFKVFPLVGDSFFKVLMLDVLLSGLLLIGPTFLMGLAFPLATHLYTERMSELGRSVGEVYSANTFGCIAGAFLAGFLMIPNLGAQSTLKVAALLYLLVGVALFLGQREGKAIALTAVSGLLALMIVALPRWNPGVMGGGVAIYAGRHQNLTLDQAMRSMFRPPAYYADGLSCTVSINYYGQRYEEMAMRVNGKVDASLGRPDKQTMFLTGYLPALLHPAPKQVAVVGLGSGFTLQALANVPEVEHIDCAELEPAVVEVGKYWAGYNGHVLEGGKVEMHVTDGRTFVLGSAKQFDIIASEPSNPWIAGIGNLFTRDFYQTCSRRLAPGGVMCQWFNLYAVSNQDLKMVLKSYYTVFPYGLVFQSAPGDLLLLGSNEPIQFDLERLENVYQEVPQLRRHFYEIGLYEPESILGHYLFDRETALAAAGDAPFNTDDRPLLEFSAPLSLYSLDQMAVNLNFLRENHQNPLPPGIEATPERLKDAAFGWLNQGDTERAEALVAATKEPDEKVALVAALLTKNVDKEKGNEAFARSLALFPNSGLIAAQWAAHLDWMNTRYEEGVALSKIAVADPPAGSESFVHLIEGMALVRTDQLDAAEEAFQKSIAANPDDADAYSRLGYCLLKQDKLEQAVTAFKQALERNHTDPFAYNGLAQTEFKQNNIADARVHFEKAIELVPDDVNALMNLGLCYLKAGDNAAASRTFHEVLRYAPGHDGALRFLAELG